MSGDHLEPILARKRGEVAALRARGKELAAAAADAPPVRPWAAALRAGERVALIAELKRRAPSAGSLRPDLDPVELARTYGDSGAAALSVLTDVDFAGELQDLERARGAVLIPALRKDFVLDPVQIWESRAAGADAVLLIARALSDGELERLLDVAAEAGLSTLVEVHDEEELEGALAVGAEVIGINNRDLRTFATSIDVTRRLAPSVPADRVLVAESGIESERDVAELGRCGVDAVLVGRALVTSANPASLVTRFASCARSERR